MDDLTRAWVAGTAGLDKIDDAMNGDLAGAMRASYIEELANQDWDRQPPGWQPRSRPAGPLLSLKTRLYIAAVAAVLIILILAAGG
jgi:hypothetical protein